ncbi:hypothetical protein ENSA5_09500 [Enhygromyxa salina]|uniref:Uncharacterized protein n=1 Tax=Enhygromyxa salina TaxID=215803 RepID=A0A2S9YGK7_9BACT|nr:hypothetical protein ENSA5_09500 [Enhygromyxa salina]
MVSEALPGLPGPGLEDLWVTSHPVAGGSARVDALGPAHAESKTGPQGVFSIALTEAREHVIVVRADPTGPALAARRIDTGPDAPRDQLILTVPQQ